MTTFHFVGDTLAIDFANTVAVAEGKRVDLLGTPDDLRAWLREADIATSADVRAIVSTPRQAAALLGEAKSLRSAVRAAIEAIAGGLRVPSAALREVNRYLESSSASVEIRAKGATYELVERRRIESSRELFAPIARSLADLLCFRDPSLIRKCEGENCILYFLDTSKAHRRRWCSMSGCGNRAKAAGYYRRMRTSAG